MASFSDTFRQAEREAADALDSAAQARSRLLEHVHSGSEGTRRAGSNGADATAAHPSDWAGYAAPAEAELEVPGFLVPTSPRAEFPRSGPARENAERGDAQRANPGTGDQISRPRASTNVGPGVSLTRARQLSNSTGDVVGFGGKLSHSAGLSLSSGERGKHVVDLFELDAKVRWWRIDNEYIYFGHRRPPAPHEKLNSTLKRMAISLVYPIHNQTANVWTHVCGSIIVGAIIWHTFSRKGPMRGSGQASALDIAAEAGFLFGALACLVLSATFHLFCDASLGVRRFCLKLDFAGVLCLVWGSWLPLLQFGLACRHYSWRMAYAGTITGGVIVVAILCLLPRFATPAYQPVRAAVFLFIGWVGAVPAAQLIIDQHTRPIGLGIIYMGLLYSVGTVIDVLRFPERMFFRPAPPSIILIAVGGAKEGGDDGLRGSIHIDLDATVGSPAAVAPGLSDVTEEDGEGAAVHSSAMNSNASSGMNSPKQGQRNTPISPSASFGGIGFLNRSRSGSDAEQRMLDLAPRPNTVTSTILGSGSALDLLRCVTQASIVRNNSVALCTRFRANPHPPSGTHFPPTRTHTHMDTSTLRASGSALDLHVCATNCLLTPVFAMCYIPVCAIYLSRCMYVPNAL
ncbi:hemolysin-III related-domain-containing protein [Pavlovales sp. CCMP2436]|nr:hemolysin-III related-domain-containing protein [Pavlovales sp. CCMP2436]